MKIGILALQGAFIEHKHMLDKLGVDSFEIRKQSDLMKAMDGIIIPGGESTVIYKLINDLDLKDTLLDLITKGLPTFGTCAGLLLLAKTVENYQESFLQTMNINATKNAYGRQLGSFRTEGHFNQEPLELVFIRAPYINEIGNDVKVLSIHEGKIVAARENNQLVTAFHPELSKNTIVHQYFIEMCEEYKNWNF